MQLAAFLTAKNPHAKTHQRNVPHKRRMELLVEHHALVVDNVLDGATGAELPQHKHFLLLVERDAQEGIQVVMDCLLHLKIK